MHYEKSPASRKAGRGLFLALFFLLVPVVSFSLVSQTACASLSVSQGFYDLQLATPGELDRVTGQALTWMMDRDKYGIGVNVESAKAEVLGGAIRLELLNTMFVIEKPVVQGVFVGAGLGVVRWFANGTMVMLCNNFDVYGRVHLVKIGNASVGTFLTIRYMSPTPIGNIRVMKSGIEVGLGR